MIHGRHGDTGKEQKKLHKIHAAIETYLNDNLDLEIKGDWQVLDLNIRYLIKAGNPVLDKDGLMVGIVTFDDAMDVMVEEATEDITKMAAINPSEKTYFNTSTFAHAKNRIPWLLILMLTSIITGTIITKYEDAFAAIPLLVSFIPMLMDTGGNCGSQSSTLVIRGLALSEIHFKDIFKVNF